MNENQKTMTQRLKEAIDALQSLKDLPENKQESIAAEILGLVESVVATKAKSPWGLLWRDLTAHERAEEFQKWVTTKSGGPGLTLEQTHRDTIYE